MIVELTTAAAGLAVAGAAAELLARLGLARRGRVFVHHPHARRRSELSQDALPDMPSIVRFTSNADGERAGPVPADPEGTLRVLVAGGSAAECFMLDQDTTWPAQLESRLRDDPAIGRPVHVGNVARSLIACRQIDAVLAAALPRFRSIDVIVLMVGASDLVSWLEARTPPEIARGDVDLASYCEDHPFGPFRWTLKGSALYRVARRASARFRGEDPLRKNVGSSLVKHRAMRAAATTVLEETLTLRRCSAPSRRTCARSSGPAAITPLVSSWRASPGWIGTSPPRRKRGSGTSVRAAPTAGRWTPTTPSTSCGIS